LANWAVSIYGCVKARVQRDYRGALTLGEVAFVDPGPICRVALERDRLMSEFSHSLGRLLPATSCR